MRKFIPIVLGCIALSTPFFAQNLIQNGDFEAGNDTNWAMPSNLEIQSADTYAGSYAAKVSSKGYFNQSLSVEAGKTYVVSCYAKQSAAGQASYMSTQYNVSSWKYSSYVVIDGTDWQEYRFVLKPDSDEVTQFRLGFLNAISSTVYIDNVSVLEVDATSLSSAKDIQSFTYGGVDNEKGIVWGIPYSGISVEEFYAAVGTDLDVDVKVFSSAHKGVLNTEQLSSDMIVEVFAEDGSEQKYDLLVQDNVVISVQDGESVVDQDQQSISGISPVMTINEFINVLELPSTASGRVKGMLSMEEIADPASSILNDTMVLGISGAYASSVYSLSFREAGTANDIETVLIGQLDQANSVWAEVPNGIRVEVMELALTVSEYASFDVLNSDETSAAGSAVVTADMIVRITAESGDVHDYAIQISSSNYEPELLSDGKHEVEQLVIRDIELAGDAELHVLSEEMPLLGSLIEISSSDAFLMFDNIKPTQLLKADFLDKITLMGAELKHNQNVMIVAYVNGSVIVPHGPDFKGLTIFDQENFNGNSGELETSTYYMSEVLGDALNNAIRSFKLKRGYMATFADKDNGSGYSRVYVADKEHLEIASLPPELSGKISFIRVFKWRWTSKKGYPHGEGKADHLNCGWRYDWNNVAASTMNVEYVPMRHNSGWNSYANINNNTTSTHVLGFNEPSHTDQANMTVDQALNQWPRFFESGMRIGSPAPADNGLGWLFSFMSQAEALNYRIDFVAMHWYLGCQSAQSYYNRLKYVYEVTGRPIWITEWNNGANWTTNCIPSSKEAQANKIASFIHMLDTTSFVERYCIYDWLGDPWNLYADRNNNTLNPAGEVYRNQKSGMAYDSDFEVVPSAYVPNELVNIAKGKAVQVSSSHNSTYVGSKAVDGNISSDQSRWVSSASSGQHWIEIDFEAEVSFKALKFYTGYEGYFYPAKAFKFQVWKDNAWLTVFEETNNGHAVYSREFEEQQSQKVRLLFSKVADNMTKLYEVQVFSDAYSVPETPANLTASAVSDSKIVLEWDDIANNESVFRIEMKEGYAGTYSEIAEVGEDVVSYEHAGLNEMTSYFYRVRAEGEYGYSAYSNEAYATTKAAGTEQQEVLQELDLFPNPVEDELTVAMFLLEAGNVEISFLDMSGKVLQKSIYTAQSEGTRMYRFPVKKFASVSGTMLCRIVVENEIYLRKVIVK